MFKNVKLVKEYKNYTETTKKGGRVYNIGGNNPYKSVTTYIKDRNPNKFDEIINQMGIENWNELSYAGTHDGSLFHSYCEQLLENETIQYKKSIHPKLNDYFKTTMKGYLKEHINNIVLSEAVLFSHKYKLAGRVDLIAEFDGVLSVIDFKTSNKPKKKEWIGDYELQTELYRRMFKEMYFINITQKVIIMLEKQEGTIQTFIENI